MSRQSGLTLVEILVTVLILSGLTLVSARIFIDLRRNEKVAFDDMMRLAERRLFGQILRRDLIRIAPSMNVVQVASDPSASGATSDPYSSFFDLNSALSCNESLPNCGRTLTLARPASGEVSLSFLVDPPKSSGELSIIKSSDTLVSGAFDSKKLADFLRRGDVLSGQAPTYPAHQLFLLKSYVSTAVMRPKSGGASAPVSMCHCTDSRNLIFCDSTAACGQTTPVPYYSESSFVGFYDSTSRNFLFVSGVPLRNFHPNNPAIGFAGASGAKSFMDTLPDLSSALYKPVSLIRYSLKSNGELTRAEWKNVGTSGFEPGLTIATSVRKLTFRRKNVSIGIVSQEIQQDSTMGLAPTPTPKPTPTPTP